MAPRLATAILFLALCGGCGTTRVVRLDTRQGEPLEYRPPSSKSIEVDAGDFEDALERLMLAAPLTLRSPQQGWLVRASYPSDEAYARSQRLMSKSFGGLCEEGQRRADCLSLLDDVLELDEWDKLGVALALSLDPLKESITQAVEKTLAPQLFFTVISTGLISWAVLAANPEPVFTKAAAVVSALLLIYLGVEVFLELVDASRELKRATDRATAPRELERAGQRFAERVGPEVARVAVLAVTVGVSYGMTGGAALLASRLPLLPSFSEAAAIGASRVGLNLANVGQVSAVAVSASGTITITLPATAIAMTATGSGSGSAGAKGLPSDGPGEWVQVNESMSESARNYQAQVTGAPKGYAYRVKANGEEVDFDGFQDEALVDAKGPGYARFITDKLDPKGFFKGADKLLKQAERQLKVSGNTPIRWIVAEKKFADALRRLFTNIGYDIEIVHVPPAP